MAMFFIAAMLVASCSGSVVASESEVFLQESPLMVQAEIEVAALFQSATSVKPTMLKGPNWDSVRALTEDDDEAVLLEDAPEVDSGECLQHRSSTTELKEQEESRLVVIPDDGIAGCFVLFQDVFWFGLAFAVFCIWRLRMEKAGKELPQKVAVGEEGAKETIIRRAARSAPKKFEVDALVQAMYSENKDDLRKFLDERSVNAFDEVACCTALHVAAHYSCLPAAEALLARNADVNVCDAWDETPLHFAARAGNEEVCALLLKNRADVNASNADGTTPLITAAQAQKAKVCELLLDHGAHVGGAAEDEISPLLANILQCRILLGGRPVPEAPEALNTCTM